MYSSNIHHTWYKKNFSNDILYKSLYIVHNLLLYTTLHIHTKINMISLQMPKMLNAHEDGDVDTKLAFDPPELTMKIPLKLFIKHAP